MDKYIIIRSDTKSISPPISKEVVIKKLRQYNKDGICSYVIYDNFKLKSFEKYNLYNDN